MRTRNKKQYFSRLSNKRGSVLLTTYMLIAVLLFLGAAFLVVSTNEGRSSESQRKTTQAFYVAEAGIERAIYNLKADFAADEDWGDGEINGWTYDSTDTDAAGFYPFPDASDVNNNTYLSTGLNGGSYAVGIMNVAGADDIWVRSTGTIDGISQTILIYARIVNLSPWDNAIFGGAGASGGWVNGNVNVSGSVHILGDGLDPGDNAIDLGGTAELVRNNYDGLDPALEARVPALPTTVFNGDTVETLNAELRVKNGIVGLSGSSTIGEPDNPGDGEKETVDGVYVNDGYNGNKGSVNVYSDNGFSEGYDLGDAVVFPSLNDPYPTDPSKDYYQYFSANALILTNELSAVTPGSNFSYGNCASNCITMDGSGNMVVQGLIYVDSNNDLSLSSGDINYSGTGSILVTGDAEIDANLRTVGNNSFPSNVLGVMTPNDIDIGSSAQRDIMGLFYAEGEVTTSKQTDLMGTLVANYFNISGQVPNIYQVPETVKNLPPGMIAGDATNVLRIISWQNMDNPI